MGAESLYHAIRARMTRRISSISQIMRKTEDPEQREYYAGIRDELTLWIDSILDECVDSARDSK